MIEMPLVNVYEGLPYEIRWKLSYKPAQWRMFCTFVFSSDMFWRQNVALRGVPRMQRTWKLLLYLMKGPWIHKFIPFIGSKPYVVSISAGKCHGVAAEWVHIRIAGTFQCPCLTILWLLEHLSTYWHCRRPILKQKFTFYNPKWRRLPRSTWP